MNKKRIVWLCHLSNQEIRTYLPVRVPLLERIIRRVTHNPSKVNSDYAIWNTNGIREFEKFTEEIDLSIIAPYHYLECDEVRFSLRGINYYFFKDKPSYLLMEFRKRFLHRYDCSYKENRKRILHEINRINPDVIHVIGAENPYYSIAALDIPRTIPCIVQLQTMLSDPKFKENYFMRPLDYSYRQKIEARIIHRADYIGTTASEFIPIVKSIKPSAQIIPICLALTEKQTGKNSSTSFDFVYFASSIDKAADWAVEAFAIAHNSHPKISLDIIGSGSVGFVENLKQRVEELGLSHSVTFEGRLATHDDVIKQIRKARFALLPLKIDLISGTIREAMANGLPVVTTITPATPSLNALRESVLLSEKGDHNALSANMCRLIEDDEFSKTISDNAILTASESRSNESDMKEWKDFYCQVVDR